MRRANRLTIAFYVLAGVLGVAVPASANDIAVSTGAGKEVRVTTRTMLSETGCQGSYRQVDLGQPPTHGSVAIRPGRFVFKTDNPKFVACNGTEMDGTIVFYTPAAGFAGTDNFVIVVPLFSHTGKNRGSDISTVTITVQ